MFVDDEVSEVDFLKLVKVLGNFRGGKHPGEQNGATCATLAHSSVDNAFSSILYPISAACGKMIRCVRLRAHLRFKKPLLWHVAGYKMPAARPEFCPATCH